MSSLKKSWSAKVTEEVCDRASVGAIAKDYEGKILLVERMRYPYGWAPPSGHLDGHTFQVACFDEFEEATGLKIVGAPRPITPKNSRKYFTCQRGGEYHDWQIFEVNWQGELNPSKGEVKSARWCSREEIEDLAAITKSYLERKNLQKEWSDALERAWQIAPGLEPVWCEFFYDLKII